MAVEGRVEEGRVEEERAVEEVEELLPLELASDDELAATEEPYTVL